MYIVLQETSQMISPIYAAFPISKLTVSAIIRSNLIVLVCCCSGMVLMVKEQEKVLMVEGHYLEIILGRGY